MNLDHKPYVPIVKAYLPSCQGRALATRADMLRLRDLANIGSVGASAYASDLFGHVQYVVTEHVFHDMDDKILAALYKMTSALFVAGEIMAKLESR